ncbi:snRNA-activating protein complex subunit 1-like [Arctopsyche grandis]|uniref:snRNA-activating protein complex subunit 1-like n=1 Tax=Arctopsyche grandis TaxID=121162 RepID=UPI00406D8E4C
MKRTRARSRIAYSKYRESIGPSTSDAPPRPNKTKLKSFVYKTLPSIADGFEDDCNELIQAFLQRDCIRYSTFRQLWIDTEFDLIFSGRPSLQELCEFYDEAVNIAAKLLFNANTDENYHRCIAGLYTIYSIHQKDSTSRKACVRVVSSMSKILQEMQVYARENGHLDLLYILCSMLRDGVFRFVATSRDYGLEFSYWKYIDRDLLATGGKRAANNDLKDTFSIDSDSFTDLTDAFDTYHKLKCRLNEDGGDNPPKEMNFVDRTFPEQALRSLNSLVNSEKDEERENFSKKVENLNIRPRTICEANGPKGRPSQDIKNRFFSPSLESMGECMTETCESEDDDIDAVLEEISTVDQVGSSVDDLPMISQVPNVIIEIVNETDDCDKNKSDAEFILGV